MTRHIVLLASVSFLLALPVTDALSTHRQQHQHLHESRSLENQTFKNLAAASASGYALVDTYNSVNFFSSFKFFQGTDPTAGYVNYQSQSNAQSQGLVNTNKNLVYMGVDHTTTNPASPGRNSVRVTSNKAYNHGLFIADIAHMPGSICGVWPAFWLFGPNWPASGEIDIIEGVNTNNYNTMALHTSAGCSVTTAGSQSGTVQLLSDCNANNANNGCGATNNNSEAYGDTFNAIGGGVFAMQWESSGIYIWFFPRGSIPSDITNGVPVTTNWGTPVVAFNGGSGCDIDSHFANQNIVFDTTFCGTWAGSVWSGTCAAQANTCNTYVAQNPSAFVNAYWSINSVKVYQ
ncbi:concanavalin A-like lectin/glucanase domain-containing protein [Calycina marina]|uniref:endo-1,3(4)-beta-glucanase n=1 Tax=Calycina marina TaxID=1763456 RepID=A0A9P7YUE0_9HELO|nr:concanavalin A-like lectin/glucanase domain-containing protein [Calycina marina]